MSREIIFRGIRIDNGQWVYGYYVKNKLSGKCYIIDAHKNAADPVKVIPETVGEYTGLEDKKGAQIFEGDVLQDYAKNGKPISQVVIFWSIGFWDGEPLEGSIYRLCYAGYKRAEVIGNIHQNPELLEATK